jgi:predicted nucleic acid-binding protein
VTTAVDTNVLISLWSGTAEVAAEAATLLAVASDKGPLIIAPAVYAELVAAPERQVEFVEAFIGDAGIQIDWVLEEAVWRLAAGAYRGYVARRRTGQSSRGVKRILADFLIGAHAVQRGALLLTFDERLYRAAFPALPIMPSEV